MTKIWKKKTQEEIHSTVFKALQNNINYTDQVMLGIPASYLDEKVFNQDASFVKEAPFISTLIQNPNHIGCHTLGASEPFFEGTQALEKELIEICAVDILKAEPNSIDGYVASGGTEANLQAIWVYRNYFKNVYNAHPDSICILCSEDSHYSMNKASNVLSIDLFSVKVDATTRTVKDKEIEAAILEAKSAGKQHFIVIANMMTTMFGSIDNVDAYTIQLEENECNYKLHVDGAYGGFYYPFTNEQSIINFKNKSISSFTLDAHKMAQAPYGTGIFLMRKGMLEHANTKEASYVAGEDFTLIGSRSGANAVAVWMILAKNGPFGWQEKVFILQKRTSWLCKQFDLLDIEYYRHPHSNLVTIRSAFVSPEIAAKFGLVPDNHQHPSWYKVVVMEHVTIEKLTLLLDALEESLVPAGFR